jgi:ribose 5-phosphate isomerase B
MKIAIGTDHAGFDHKEAIVRHLRKLGHEVVDYGTRSAESCDYPVFIRPAAEAVATGQCDRAIVLGGSGNGEAIVANKVKGVRCALCWSEEIAKLAREHNNANCVSIGARFTPLETALRIIDIFLSTPFEGGRHERRVSQIE